MAGSFSIIFLSFILVYFVADSVPFIIVDLVQDNESIIAEKIRNAGRRHSWFYVTNPSLTASMKHNLFTQSAALFNLPLSQKLALSKNETHYGYLSNATEQHDAQHQSVPDLKEVFHVQHYRSSADENASNLATQNQWPSSEILPAFKETYMSHIDALVTLSMKLSEYFALSLNVSADYFNSNRDCFDAEGYNAGIRVIRYQRTMSNVSRNIFGCGAHSDHGMFTVLYSNGVPGLQFYDYVDELWYDVPFVDNAMIVIVGDALKRWSNGRYLSTRHRVAISQIVQTRLSVAFFWTPKLECLMQCVPSICNEKSNEQGMYSQMTFGQYVDDMHRQIYMMHREDMDKHEL